MSEYQAGKVIGFHSCDRELGLRLVNGQDELKQSTNDWDWLGPGAYFWEDDPDRALQYAEDCAAGRQINKIPIKVPIVVGAIIEMGNCLNLVETEALQILTAAYDGLKQVKEQAGEPMPINRKKNRALDCAVIKYIHQANADNGIPPYDTVRCPFTEGEPAYPGAMISSQLHVQICVLNPDCVQGYFLPKPIDKNNPYLNSTP